MDLSDTYKQRIAEEATIYKVKKRELTDFEKRVNSAAVQLCLEDVSLLNRRGELLQQARKRVAEDGYIFKKGRSRSKVYGEPDVQGTSKRPKYCQAVRDERLQVLQDELSDVVRVLHFKEKRLAQAEAGKNYRTCEQIMEEMMVLKSRKSELETEKHMLERNQKRAKLRMERLKRRTSESSDLDDSISNRSTSKSRSTTPAASPFLGSRSSFSSAHDPEEGPSQLSSIDIDSHSRPAGSVAAAGISVSPSLHHSTSISSAGDEEAGPCPLSPSCQGSQLSPILCEPQPDLSDVAALPHSPSCETHSLF